MVVRIELMVLAAGSGSCAAVELGSGGLVRARYPVPAGVVEQTLSPFDVATGVVAEHEDAEPRDEALPDAVTLVSPPRAVGRLRRRHADRFLRPLHHPTHEELLGFAGPAIPYWTLKGDRPSLAIVALGTTPVVERVTRDGLRSLRCRFTWRGRHESLPVHDSRVVAAMATFPHDRLAGPTLARVVGGAPRRILVALSSPREGHCYKVVAALLPG